jgi:hypothetical protein
MVRSLAERVATPGRVYAKGKKKDVHVEVWEAINGPVPEGYTVHHIDHDKANNHISNLMVMTHQQHSAHHNQKHPLMKSCVVCGVTFTPHPTKRARQQTCGTAPCRSALISRKAHEHYGTTGPVTLTCPTCDEEFVVPAHRATKAKYCSRDCSNKATRRM